MAEARPHEEGTTLAPLLLGLENVYGTKHVTLG